MKSKSVIGIIAVLIVVIIIIVIASSSAHSSQPTAASSDTSLASQPAVAVVTPGATSGSSAAADTSASTAAPMTATTQLFSTSRYAAHSYLIYPGAISAASKAALDGFDMTTADAGNGLTKVSLIAKKQDYQTQTFTLAVGQKLYFVETSMGDDEPGQDYDYDDDHAFAVDASGYILK